MFFVLFCFVLFYCFYMFFVLFCFVSFVGQEQEESRGIRQQESVSLGASALPLTMTRAKFVEEEKLRQGLDVSGPPPPPVSGQY